MNRLRRIETILKNNRAEDASSRQGTRVAEQQTSGQTQIASEVGAANTSQLAAQRAKQIEEEDLAEFDKWDPMREDYNSPKNTLTVDANSEPLTKITGKLQPISSKIGNVTICEHFATHGDCADGRFCEKIHVDPEARQKIWALQNTYESNKGRTCLNFTYLSPIDLKPDPNVLLLVSVASAKSPSTFHAVAPFENLNFANLQHSDIDFYVKRIQQQSPVKKKLERFHLMMADVFGHSYRVDNLNDEIYLSQIVGCKLKDGHFRRAMVTGLPDMADFADLNYKLYLIDIGVEVELPRELIYDIKADTLSEPPLALDCRLDIKPANGALNWSPGALAQFQALIRKNRFSLCKIIDHIKADGIFTVDLLDLYTRTSFTAEMLASGLAVQCLF